MNGRLIFSDLIHNLVMFHCHHLTVVCLVAWPLNESEASVDHVLIEPLLPFCKFLLISMRTASLTSRQEG